MLTGIHGDEDAAWPDQTYVMSIKVEIALSGCEGRKDGEDLLGHHRQHLDVDTVELIEAAPCSRLFRVDTMKYAQTWTVGYPEKCSLF